MSKYTAKQVREAIESFSACDIGGELIAIAEDYIALLRDRESAKAAVTDEAVEQLRDAIGDQCNVYANEDTCRSILEDLAPMLASARVPDAEMTALKNLAYDMRQQAGNNNRLTHIGWAQRVERVVTMLAAAPKPEEE